MAKKTEQRPGFGKILDAWVPRADAGSPIGCLASTYTVDTGFFEEECLGRFLQLETNAEDHGPAYLIEREEKLAGVSCGLIVDVKNARGKRSPRWDFLPARVSAACQHSKVSILRWENLVRVIVASANVTEAGYCTNREVFGILEFYRGGAYPVSLAKSVTGFMRRVLEFVKASPEANLRAQEFLTGVDTAIFGMGLAEAFVARDPVKVDFFSITPNAPSIFDQMRSSWPAGTMADRAVVTSPFFDVGEKTNKPAEVIWELLRSRGDATLTYHVPCEFDGERRCILTAPKSLVDAKPRRISAKVEVCGISPRASDPNTAEFNRALHAKVMHVSDGKWSVTAVGSSNFTSRGLGLISHSNIEANLAYIINAEREPASAREIYQAIPAARPLPSDSELVWKPLASDLEEDAVDDPVLPSGFIAATLHAGAAEVRLITVSVGKDLPRIWRICAEGQSASLYDHVAWKNAGLPDLIEMPWVRDVAPSGLDVYFDDNGKPAMLPVNISESSVLPPPDELRDLPLDLLIEILASSAPLHRVVMRWRERHEGRRSKGAPIDSNLDAHSRVDDSSFLLKRTRRIAGALIALRRSLERPLNSLDSLNWRLYGPVGVDSVSRAIQLEARSDEERVFLLTELVLELSRVNPASVPHGPPQDKIRQKIHDVMLAIQGRINEFVLDDNHAVWRYQRSVLAEIIGDNVVGVRP